MNSAWNSSQGIGQIYSEGHTDATTYGFLRGGDWSSGSLDGVESLNLLYGPGYAGGTFGFRCSR
jgi:hypothetical protein